MVQIKPAPFLCRKSGWKRAFSTASTWKVSGRQKAQLFDGLLDRIVGRKVENQAVLHVLHSYDRSAKRRMPSATRMRLANPEFLTFAPSSRRDGSGKSMNLPWQKYCVINIFLSPPSPPSTRREFARLGSIWFTRAMKLEYRRIQAIFTKKPTAKQTPPAIEVAFILTPN